ncbi:CIA30 family protein [Gymnodinialimonas sp. 2305UL16-5]|uniref:CIA30 family protein n=1 Tax=Gymnodinialimonas mytili TaxID=3126503 RepID=UPI003098FCFD
MIEFESFEDNPAARWTYVADGVMGGVSEGQIRFAETDDGPAVHLSGEVSTENNGGFIQVRRRFDGGWPATASGLSIRVRGNGETYYIFLRTHGLARVWFSYRFAFRAEEAWRDIDMPFSQFTPSHPGMPADFDPALARGIGLVAYGDDYEADIWLSRVSLY